MLKCIALFECSQVWPDCPLIKYYEMKMSMEHWYNDIDRKNGSKSKKKFLSLTCHGSTKGQCKHNSSHT